MLLRRGPQPKPHDRMTSSNESTGCLGLANVTGRSTCGMRYDRNVAYPEPAWRVDLRFPAAVLVLNGPGVS